jgi:hypothetical protein
MLLHRLSNFIPVHSGSSLAGTLLKSYAPTLSEMQARTHSKLNDYDWAPVFLR